MGSAQRQLTAWKRGSLRDGGDRPPALLFGRMHEDWLIEAEALPEGGRLFCIASACRRALPE